MLQHSPPDPLDRVFGALADPARRGMVERLSQQPASAGQLASHYAMTLSAVVQHLKVLEASGIVVSHKAGRVRTFTVQTDALAAVQRWIDARKLAWHQSLDRLDALLREEQP
jgi:DNA-binding transcriptional ArsR family regulator